MGDIFKRTKDMFVAKQTKNNNRYDVYKMRGRVVSFSFGGETFKGKVKEVYRDVLNGDLRIKVGDKQFRFKEPNLIRVTSKEIVFFYGDVGASSVTDKELFDEMRKEQFHETIEDTVIRLDPEEVRKIVFNVIKKASKGL